MSPYTRRLLLRWIAETYQFLNRHLVFRLTAQNAHDKLISGLRLLERIPFSVALASLLHRVTVAESSIEAGGVELSQPLILAAGLLKGDAFDDEHEALRAVTEQRRNIIPGWRLMPALVGPVEFGSFTRYPRLGNPDTVVWRLEATQSTQNHFGLPNPGARAAARFLADHMAMLPRVFGINIAVSPGVQDIEQQSKELRESLSFFLDASVHPSWFTLNLSCPNTVDDPLGHQLESETIRLCNTFIATLCNRELDIPVWVKISPQLAAEQYFTLLRIFHEVGVKAVVATNTVAQPSPEDSTVQAGVGGGELFDDALTAVRHLTWAKRNGNYAVDIIGSGGILDGASYRKYRDLGVQAAQYWSALVYRGPFAAAIIESELAQDEYEYQAIHRESLA